MINEPNYGKEKPQFLYRGVKIRYELLKDFEFDGIDLKPPYPPKIDKDGRKTVGDGNEYGVYMSDYKSVAREAYAKVSIYDGTPINKNVKFGDRKDYTMIPSVGIVYKINTEGLDVHIPWITPHLRGHYNNGMIGDEWIAESIPDENYIIDTIEIGPDTLHESEMIEFDDISNVKEKILNIINERKERLEIFEVVIEAMSPEERMWLDSKKINVLKSIYKLNGISDIDINKFSPKSTNEYLDYIKAVIYQKDKENVDFTTLSYIQELEKKVGPETKIQDIIKEIENDIKLNKEKKESFIKGKKEKGMAYTTKAFDMKYNRYLNILEILKPKTRKDNKHENFVSSLRFENPNDAHFEVVKETENKKEMKEKPESPIEYE